MFTYAALLPWTFFSTALTFAAPSLIINSHIITKTYFPREIVPLSSVLAALVDFSVASLVFVGMLAFYRITPTWNVLYVVPVLMLQLTFTTAVCLLLAAFIVLYRDARFTLPLLLQIWMFATRILYPLSMVPESARGIYLIANPMAVVIDAYRRVILQGQPPALAPLATAGIISLVLLLLGYRYFKRLEREFADIV